MDLLQSFMGCMYPGSIRTESIESMENDYPDYIFHVRNIDERRTLVSEGELHLNYNDLVYYRPGKVPTRWPLNSIRRYGTDRDAVFIFEAGRSSPKEGIFAFQLNRTVDTNKLANRITEILQKLSSNNQTNNKNSTFKNDQNVSILTGQFIPDQLTQGNQPTMLETFTRHQQRKKDASTSTDNNQTTDINNLTSSVDSQSDPRPLSYVLIDFETTKALEESAQAHAASRQTYKNE